MSRLPAGWRLTRFSEVADTALGKMLDRGKDKGHAEVPYLRNVNVQWGRITTDDVLTMQIGRNELERYAVRDGDLLVCEGGEVGRCAIWRGGTGYLAYQKALHRVRPHADLDTKYLRYLLESYAGDGTLKRYSTGSTIAHLPQQQLKDLPVPLPHLTEQRRIVDVLEDHLSRLEAASTLRQQAAKRIESFRRATLATVINQPDRRQSSLGALIERIEAGRSFGGSAGPARTDQWGIIKVSAMTWGRFRAEENKAVPADLVDPRYEIHSGDLLVSRANTTSYVGASVLVDEVRPKLLLSDKSLRLIPVDSINSRWLQLALSTPSARTQISAKASGTKDSMRNISQSALLSITVPNVDPEDQVADLACVERYMEAVDHLQSSLTAAARRQHALRRSLLKAAFSGQLTGHLSDAEDVPDLASTSAAS